MGDKIVDFAGQRIANLPRPNHYSNNLSSMVHQALYWPLYQFLIDHLVKLLLADLSDQLSKSL